MASVAFNKRSAFGEFVPIKDIARFMGVSRSNALKYVKKNGFVPVKRRMSDSGGQMASLLTQEDAIAVLEKRRSERFVSEEEEDAIETDAESVQPPPATPKDVQPIASVSDVVDLLRRHYASSRTAVIIVVLPNPESK